MINLLNGKTAQGFFCIDDPKTVYSNMCQGAEAPSQLCIFAGMDWRELSINSAES